METNAPLPHLSGQTQEEARRGDIPPQEQQVRCSGRRALFLAFGATGSLVAINALAFYFMAFQRGRAIGVLNGVLPFVFVLTYLVLIAIYQGIRASYGHPGLPRYATKDGKLALWIAGVGLLQTFTVVYWPNALHFFKTR